jgi:hypothetical protein
MSFGALHIDESVFAFILDSESGKFHKHKDKQFAHHLLATSPFGGFHMGVEYLFIGAWVYQNLESDKRIAPHFFVYSPSLGRGGSIITSNNPWMFLKAG